ncbi:BTB/POZ domain-containing protein 2 [Chamberlinius hualienensis]
MQRISSLDTDEIADNRTSVSSSSSSTPSATASDQEISSPYTSTNSSALSSILPMNLSSPHDENPENNALPELRFAGVPSNHLAQRHDSGVATSSVLSNRSSMSSCKSESPTSAGPSLQACNATNNIFCGSNSTSNNCAGSCSTQKQLNYNWQASKSSIRERVACMFANETLADIKFLVGKGNMQQVIPAHKFVLSIGSSVFDAMFNGYMASEAKEIELPDIEPSAFLALLKFLYSDEVEIGPETVMTTLYTAKKYAVPALEKACVEFLKENLRSDNAFTLLTQARLFDEPQLAALCLETIDKSTSEAISAEGFTDIDLDTLCAVLERDSLHIREDQLFKAVVKWSEHECMRQGVELTPENLRLVLGRSLPLVRFPLMSMEDFANGPAQSGILTHTETCNVFIHYHSKPKVECLFLDAPRSSMVGKEHIVTRFQQSETRWGYSGTSDRIRFLVDRRIFVTGFCLYGSIHGTNEYDVLIQILHTGTGKVLGSNDVVFTCDGSSSTFRVMFKEPIEIQPNTSYTASATLRGQDSHYGTKGLRKVTVDCQGYGKVTFQFTYAAGNNNGTSIEDGQIPEIIFYT